MTTKPKVVTAKHKAPPARVSPVTVSGAQVLRRRNDTGNAQRLVDHFCGELRYCPQMGKWLWWDGVRWRFDEDGALLRFAQMMVQRMYAEAAAEPDPDKSNELGRWAASSGSAAKLHAAVDLAKSDLRVVVDLMALDADPWKLGVRNGVIDLRTGALLYPDPAHLITKQAGVAFDPKADCPTWKGFLSRIFAGDTDIIGYLQRAVGYSLTGDTMAKTLFFLHGARGDNGKSTFIEALLALLGEYAVRTPAETFMRGQDNRGANPERTALRGARVVVASELSDHQRFDESFLKDVTGGIDRITARNLYESHITFKPEFKLWLYGNHKPRLRSDDDAAWRRLHLVPFEERIPIPEQDADLAHKLIAELSGILNWALVGLSEWQRKKLSPPDKVQAAGKEYRHEMDDLGRFLEEECVLTSGAQVKAAEIYTAYVKWAIENGQRPFSNAIFSRRLVDRGHARRLLDGRTLWQGIGLRFPFGGQGG